jgi:uncharacterized protein (UPF0276 family)
VARTRSTSWTGCRWTASGTCTWPAAPSSTGFYHDTHTDPTPPAVLELLAALCSRRTPPAVMLERDGHYSAAAALTAELDAIASAAGLAPVT